MSAATVAAIAKAAVAVLSNEKTRKALGWVIVAILSPLIVLVVLICAVLSGSSQHNVSAVELCFHGGTISSSATPEYRGYIEDMRGSFAQLDRAIEEINAQCEDGNSLDDTRVKAVFYALYFAAEHPDDSGIRAFTDCFVDYEERTRTVTTTDEEGNEVEVEETYTVAIPVTDMNEVYARIEAAMGITVTPENQSNADSIYNIVLYGTATGTGDWFPGADVPFISVDGFCSPVGANWESIVTSEFGYRRDPFIISLRREDAARLGYDKADEWKALLSKYAMEMARAMKIPWADFRWYAAFHDEGHHPHVHMVCYSVDPSKGFLTKQGITQIKSGLAKEIFRQELTELYQKQTQRRNELNVDAQTVLNEVINQMQSGTVQNKHIEELLQYLADHLRFLSGKKQYGYLKADLKAVVDEVVDELAKDPRVAAAYNLWYELREDVLRTYKDNLPERLPLSGQKEFKRIKNLVILEAVKLEQYQQVFHPDDLWDGNPDEHAEEAQLFVYEQMNQSMSHPPEAAEAGQARTQYALGKIYRDGQGVEKDVQKAVELFTLAAMQGNSFAAFALGKMYLSDDPALSRNVAAALKWITNAAEHGNQFAQYYLGKLLLKGTDDISQDTNSALRWLLASVEQGNVHAEYALAMAYLKGESVPKDSLKAMELLKRASSREHQFAQYQLGKLLLQGEDVPKDVVAAVHWLTASAMHGNQYAQYALGKLYLLGKGVEKDKDRAAKWFQMAANQGNEYAQYYLKHMDDPMGQSPAAAVITLFHSLANIFREQNQLPSGGIMVTVDRKLLRKIKAKKIAQGHKADDHEPKIGLQ